MKSWRTNGTTWLVSRDRLHFPCDSGNPVTNGYICNYHVVRNGRSHRVKLSKSIILLHINLHGEERGCHSFDTLPRLEGVLCAWTSSKRARYTLQHTLQHTHSNTHSNTRPSVRVTWPLWMNGSTWWKLPVVALNIHVELERGSGRACCASKQQGGAGQLAFTADTCPRTRGWLFSQQSR